MTIGHMRPKGESHLADFLRERGNKQLTLREAAEVSGYTLATLRTMVKAGRISASRLSVGQRPLVVYAQELLTYQEKNRRFIRCIHGIGVSACSVAECRRAYLRSLPERKQHLSKQESARLKRKYGVSLEEAEVMRARGCSICNMIGRRPKSAKYKMHIDHDHRSGKIRGVLCVRCNTRLGVLENLEPAFWAAAVRYLQDSGNAVLGVLGSVKS